MSLKRALPLCALAALLILGLQYTAVGQGVTTAVTTFLEGSIRAQAVVLVNPATDALVAYSTDDRDQGAVSANTLRIIPARLAAPYKSLDLDESEEEVKSTSGEVCSVWFTNTATATRWLKFYNATAASVTVGTTTPVATIGLPGNASDDITGSLTTGGNGCYAFSTAISIAATTAAADNDTGAPATGDVVVVIGYR